jgi:hypothetical protein
MRTICLAEVAWARHIEFLLLLDGKTPPEQVSTVATPFSFYRRTNPFASGQKASQFVNGHCVFCMGYSVAGRFPAAESEVVFWHDRIAR